MVKTVLLVEDVAKYANASLADNVTVRDRDELTDVLRELEQVKGVSVILYDQQCAAEAATAVAWQAGGTDASAGDQRAGLRGLRGLREAVKLHQPVSGRDAVRGEDADSSMFLQ